MLKYFAKVWYILKGSRKRLPVLMLMFCLSSILEAFGIGLIGPFLNIATKPEIIREVKILDWFYTELNLQSPTQFIALLGIGIACVFCLKSLLYFLSQTFIYKFCFNQKAKLISRLFEAYIMVPYTYYLRTNTANIIKNLTYETMVFNNTTLIPLTGAVANLTVICILLLLLANTSPTLLVMLLAVLLPTFSFFFYFKNKVRQWGKQVSESNKEIIRVINQGLGGLKETRVIGCEDFFQEEIHRQIQINVNAATKFNSFNIVPRILIETLLVVFTLLFISISQLLFQTNVQDITSVMAVFAVASIRLIPAVSQTVQAMGQIQNGRHCVDVIYLDLKEIEKQEITKSLQPSTIAGQKQLNTLESHTNTKITFAEQIELKDIVYYYPNASEPALNNINLTITKGKSIALIGKSGAGKTTLVDVLLGLLNINSGDITVDDVSIYNNIRYWQNMIGYIPQSIFLLDDTIERNIAFGVPDALIDSQRLQKAIQAAQLEELVLQLPDGVKTTVGERGVRLSGGQRQRIGIARALYHEREILVLDEATSALDNETESMVTQAIRSLSGTKTIIIIAHRLSTIEHCDCIYLLKGGHVIKSGSYEEVVIAGGVA
ncbi:ABC transporter ATP-binding protein [Nostoc sp. NIES-4103]|nr:ABC transporter ATP-binding protein [Nostoc sp. NIES-4103]